MTEKDLHIIIAMHEGWNELIAALKYWNLLPEECPQDTMKLREYARSTLSKSTQEALDIAEMHAAKAWKQL